jgi:hypothetical protein
MEPAEALAATNPSKIERKSTASAPEAASWLKHPAEPAKRLSQAQQLAAEPQWEGPDLA